jgi:hypothetical protein
MLLYGATESFNVEFTWNNSLRAVKGMSMQVQQHATASFTVWPSEDAFPLSQIG